MGNEVIVAGGRHLWLLDSGGLAPAALETKMGRRQYRWGLLPECSEGEMLNCVNMADGDAWHLSPGHPLISNLFDAAYGATKTVLPAMLYAYRQDFSTNDVYNSGVDRRSEEEIAIRDHSGAGFTESKRTIANCQGELLQKIKASEAIVGITGLSCIALPLTLFGEAGSRSSA